jgi:hypothetical protein
MGVITNGAGMSFSNSAALMIETGHWNKLEGSIARWNSSNVLMAQTAVHMPGFAGPKTDSNGPKGFKMPEFNLPEFEAFEFGEIDMSWAKNIFSDAREGLAGLTSMNKSGKSVAPQAQAIQVKATPSFVETVQVPKASQTAKKATAKPAIPALRGRYDAPKPARISTADRAAQAKLWVSATSASIRDKWNNLDIKSSVRDLQDKARPMGHKIRGLFSGKANPVTKTVAWGEKNMSVPAMLLILVFGALFLLMGLSGPTSRLGGRH